MRSRTWVAWAFMAPTLIAMAVIVFYPLVQAFFWTFTDIDRSNMGTHLQGALVGHRGPGQLRRRRSQTRFQQAFWWTIVWTPSTSSSTSRSGLLLAVILNQRLRGRTAFRLLLLVPWAIPIYISAIGWSFIFNGEFGLLNNLTSAVRHRSHRLVLGVPLVLRHAIIVNVWAGIPFMMVALLGGLQAIPQDQYEAARVDGANRWQSFRNITIPGLRSVSTTVICSASSGRSTCSR